MLCQLLDLSLGHTDVVQPLHAQFLTGAVTHSFLDIVAGLVAEQTVDPDTQLVLRLVAELLLAVQCPAEQPVGVLNGDDAAGDGVAAERVTLANLLDILRDLVVQGGNGSAIPVGMFRVGAELLGMAESGILCSDLFPQIPAVARLDGGVKACSLVLRTHGAALHTATVGDEQQIVLGQVDGAGLPRMLHDHAACLLALAIDIKFHVHDLGLIVELHAVILQVSDHGQDDGLVLVVAGKTQGGEIRQTADMVDIALEIELHFQSTVPIFKGKHGAPVQPEVGVQHLIVKEVGDLLILQLLVRGKEQLHDLHGTLIGQAELTIGVGVLTAVHGSAAERVVGVFLVQPVIFIQHAGALGLQRRDGAQHIPHYLKMVVHLAAAAHHITDVVLIAITGTAGDGVFLEHMHMLALHLTVTDQIAGSRQCCQTGADDISGFMIDTLRLFRGCKSFIVATGIVHRKASLLFIAFLGILAPSLWQQYTLRRRSKQQTNFHPCINFIQSSCFAGNASKM